MFQVTANPEKNRLYVTLEGHLEAPERLEAGKAFLAAIGQLRPGFDIVNDLSGLRPTDADGLKELRKLQAAAKIKGVRCVVRVARIPLSRLQVERTSQEVGLDSETVATLEEADARLDALGPAPPEP
jgi:anti-anti-sigma regulatory factor